jgi:hypothetical protein
MYLSCEYILLAHILVSCNIYFQLMKKKKKKKKQKKKKKKNKKQKEKVIYIKRQKYNHQSFHQHVHLI